MILFKTAFLEKVAKLRSNVELQEHQKRVLDKLNLAEAMLLYHGLGSGKTLSAIAATDEKDTDVVVPASLRENYRKELKKFVTKNKSDVMSYHKFLKKNVTPKEALVLDEVHRLGNADTAMSKKVQEEAANYKRRVLLSGSPIRNRPSDLGPLAKILSPASDVPSGRQAFEDRFIEDVIVKPNFIARLRGVKPGTVQKIKNVEQFKDLFRGKVDYHQPSKEHFPRVVEEDVEVKMSPVQKKLYDKAIGRTPFSVQYKIKNSIPLSKAEKVHLNSYLNAVRQVSNSTKAYGIDEPTPKIKRVVEDIKETLGKNKDAKTVVYSNYLKSGVEDVAQQLRKEKIPHGIFSGKLSDKKRKELIKTYNEGEIKTLLLSGAGSEGLDLKGVRLMQILEPHWNQARTDQAKGRAIRYKSHSHLPEKDREVQVKNYVSLLPPKMLGLVKGDKSVDTYLKEMGITKTTLNNQFLDILKELGS